MQCGAANQAVKSGASLHQVSTGVGAATTCVHVVNTIHDGIEVVSCYGVRQLEGYDVVGAVDELVHDALPAIIAGYTPSRRRRRKCRRVSRLHDHPERHASSRIGWLRAAVLGANDGIVSTASLIIGVAAANASRQEVLVAGVAALFAGAMSMAAGEYVSVSSQSDTEKADLARETAELETQPDLEREELIRIYEARGVERDTAVAVADQMTARDALAAHARDELGLSDVTAARPLQAAIASALTFTAGAAAPLAVVPFASTSMLVPAVAVVTLVCLTVLGGLGARAGGAPLGPSVLRVTFWGVLAMAVTAGVGRLFGTVVG